MTALLVRRVDGRLVIELPENFASQVNLREGDRLEAVDVQGRRFSLGPVEDAKTRQMRLGLAIMDQYAETYAELAK